MNQEDISIDVARCVLVICLPSSLQEESDDAFKEAIYEMLEKTFSVDKEAVEQVLRFPRLDPTSEEFGCKCVIMFRSRMLKHRVIAQKSKLDAPTEVVSILDIPKELVEPEEDLELADESTCDDDVQPGKESASPASPDSQHENIAVGCDASNNAFEADGGGPKLRNDPAVDHPAVGSEQAAAVGGVLSAKCIQRCDPEEDATVSLNDVFIVDAAGSVDSDGKEEHDSAVENTHKGTEDSTGTEGCGSVGAEIEPEKAETSCAESRITASTPKTSHAKESTKTTESGELVNLPPLCKCDKHVDRHFMTLPIEWSGAPEFQWKIVNKPEDGSTLIIENAMPSDMQNPWLYTLIIRAERVITNFRRPLGDELLNDTIGSINLLYPDDHGILSSTINYLVYLRTPKNRRLKIYLPQTPSMRQNKDELQSRLGRIREPNDSMRQLALKPLDEDIDEEQIRTVAFKHFPVETVEFKYDAIQQRCAIVTFASAELAISAHRNNDYVCFSASNGSEKWIKVLYAHAAFRSWGVADYDAMLLTRGEMKALRGAQRKEKKANGKMQMVGGETNRGESSVKGNKSDIKQVSIQKKKGSFPFGGAATGAPGIIKQTVASQKRSNPQEATAGTFPKKAKHDGNISEAGDTARLARGKPAKGAKSDKKIGAARFSTFGFRASSPPRISIPPLISPVGHFRGYGLRGGSNRMPVFGFLGAPTTSRETFADVGFGSFRGFPKKDGVVLPDAFAPSQAYDDPGLDAFAPLTPPPVMDMAVYDSYRSRTEVAATAFAPSVEKRIRGERKPLSMPDSLIFGRQRADSEKNLNGRSLDAFAHSSAAGYGGVSDSWVHRQQRRGQNAGEVQRAGFFFGSAWR